MTDSKLHILLSRLSAYELNRFGTFLASPYHNQDQKLISLFDALRPHYRSNNTADPDKYKIWKKVQPGRQFTNLYFARLLSDLLKKLETYLTIERLKKQQHDNSYHLLDLYTSMKLDKHFTEPYLHARRQLESQPLRDHDYYLHTFRLDEQLYTFMENKGQRSTEKHLTEAMHSLDSFYLVNKLRYCASILHYRHFLSMQEDTALLTEIMSYLERQPPASVPVADAYYRAILTLVAPEQEAHYTALKQLFFQHLPLMAEYTRRELFVFALNYCIRRINKGDTSYLSEILTLYQYALDHELLYQDGILSPWDYKNIVTIALRGKDHGWARTFIETYKKKLPKDEQVNAYTFNMARYFFAVRQYDQVLKLLQDVEYNDVFYQLDSKTTLMKTYYELDAYPSLLSLRESFRMLLDRKKLISEQNKVNYGNFSRLILKLYRVDVKNKARLTALRKEIETTSNTADRTWIQEKLNELDPK